jgi:hypothetical protein
MLKTTGLVAGHYECRSLDETLPVFTDLMAMKVIERKPGEATVKHPHTDWKLIVHEGGPSAPEKTLTTTTAFASPATRKLKQRGNLSKRIKKNIV